MEPTFSQVYSTHEDIRVEGEDLNLNPLVSIALHGRKTNFAVDYEGGTGGSLLVMDFLGVESVFGLANLQNIVRGREEDQTFLYHVQVYHYGVGEEDVCQRLQDEGEDVHV